MVRLVERERELLALHEVVARAVGGGAGATAVVLGAPGIGKTALLREAAGGALRARGGELEQEFPYGVLRQLFEGTVRCLDDADRAAVLSGPARPAAAVLLAEADATAPGDAFAVEHAFFWLTVHLSERSAVVLTVDDVQWADLASLRALLYLSRRIADLPVALVLAGRPADGARRAVLDRLADDASVVLAPAPLRPAGVRAVVQRELPVADDAFCDACHAASGGNPFLLSEVVGAVRAAGVDPVAGNVHELRAAGMQGVTRSVLLRLDAVSPAAAAVARTLAVLGPTHPGRLLAELSGVPVAATTAAPGDLRTALEQLRAAHLLEPDDPPRFDPRHRPGRRPP